MLGSHFTGGDGGWWGESFGTMEERTEPGMQRAKWRDSHTEDQCYQHSPAWVCWACLLIPRGRWGLGAEAWASEVRSRGEDWGWLHEHSLRGLVHHRQPGGSPGNTLHLPKRQETIVLGCARRGDSFSVCPQKAEHHRNELQRQEQAVDISLDTRDGLEMLTLLLKPPKILCASTGHYHMHPPPTSPQKPVQSDTAKVP